MLSFKAVQSAGGAAHYFESSDDYYSNEDENTFDHEEEEALGLEGGEAKNVGGPSLRPGKGAAGDGDGDEDGLKPGGGNAPGGSDGSSIAPGGAGMPGSGVVPGPGIPSAPALKKNGHKGVWMGKGAEALGLTGRADRQAYERILKGELPDGTQVRKGKTHGSKDRPGIDFTLSAPKSVSIQALAVGDKRLIEAHDKAVKAAMSEMERYAMARKKEGGKSVRENTANLVIVSFRHELSRAQDPQLHTHNIVANMTQRSDGQWRALSNEDMLRNVKMVGAFYRAQLATEVQKLGYELRETQKGQWELASVSDKAIDLFSSRSKEIERLLKARGQERDDATTMQKQIIALASRPKKTDVDRALLREYWHQMARDAKVSLDRPETSFKTAVVQKFEAAKDYVQEKVQGESKKDIEARKAVDFAIEHLRERQGIFSRREILEIAYGKGATRSSIDSIDKALESAKKDGRLVTELPLYQTARSLNRSSSDLVKDPNATLFKGHDEFEKLTRSSWVALTMHARGLTQEQAEAQVAEAIKKGAIVRAEERYTTQEAKKSEIRILGMERSGRGQVGAMATGAQAEALLAKGQLNEGQRDAVRMILTSENRYVGVQGLAGTGKSHMMAATMEGITSGAGEAGKAHGFKVIGLAPYASQAQELERLGMQAQTVAAFLAKKSEHIKIDNKTMIVLDEASTLPAHQMEKLMRIVEERGARMVMVGDRKQTQAVEAGKPFEQLQDAGMSMAYMTEIQRQKNETIKAAVVHAANDRIPAAVATLKESIQEVKEDRARYEKIAAAYTNLSADDRSKTLVVAGTNDARQQINGMIRERLGLRDDFKGVMTLAGIDMTRAELKAAPSYKEGQIIVPEGDYKKLGLEKGEQYEVLGHDPKANKVQVRDRHGDEMSFDPSKASMVGLYKREAISLAKGEEVTMTRNDKVLGIHRGEKFTVVDVNDKAVRLAGAGGKVVELSRGKDLHMRYSYVSTVHSAQGATNDRVLIEANTKSMTANKAVFYVAISRPRHELAIYTDDRKSLDRAMSREPKKYAALELRDTKNEAFFLKGKMDKTAAQKMAASLRKPQEQRPAEQSTMTKGRGL